MRTILRVLEETRRKIFDNIKKNSRIHNDTLRNRTTLKTDTLEIYSRREKRETRSNVTSSSPTCPPPLPTPPIQRWHLDRRILRSSNHQRKKKRKKTVLRVYILAKVMKYRNEERRKPEELGEKIDRSRSRFGREDGSTSPSDPASRMVAAHASMAAFLLFFRSFFSPWPTSLSLPLSPATLFDRLSRTARGPSILS